MLIAVTVMALALAAVMGVLLARTVREERRRSAARVQLLEELAAKRAAKHAAAPITDLDLRPARHVVTSHELFHEEQKASPWPRRFAVIGTMAVVLAAAIIALYGVPRAGEIATDAASSATEPAAVPLELLSLRHATDGGILTVTGLVQNPRAGAPLARVNATLFVFGADGSLLTSGRAPLDYISLTPGDESPFVIRVPVSGRVERYRVGFRGEDDRVIAHIDRRRADVAQREP